LAQYLGLFSLRNNMQTHNRRLVPRFKITGSGAVHISQNQIVSYSLLDVSKGGLAFSYREISDHENWIGKEREINLFGEGFFIADLPVKVVSDKEFDHFEGDALFNTEALHFRRCGIQFAALNINQRNQVDSYVELQGILRTQEN